MFLLQVVYPDGTQVRLPAGEADEIELRAVIRDEVLRRSKMFGRMTAEVAEEAVAAALDTFKRQFKPDRVR